MMADFIGRKACAGRPLLRQAGLAAGQKDVEWES